MIEVAVLLISQRQYFPCLIAVSVKDTTQLTSKNKNALRTLPYSMTTSLQELEMLQLFSVFLCNDQNVKTVCLETEC